MAEVKTIKDVDATTWAEFKGLAARNNSNLGAFFKTILDEYKKNANTFWADILNGPKILSDKEAEELEKITIRVRKEYGFRI